MIAKLPFAGFYNSIHDSTIDYALERMFSDRASGSVNDPHHLQGKAFMACDWNAVQVAYSEDYVKQFAKLVNIEIEFESMSSPKEYNFDTDRIFVEISPDELQRLYNEVRPETLTAVAEEYFTSRSGFISSYSSDWKNWGGVTKWDHNQAGALIDAFMRETIEEEDWDTQEGMDWRIAELLSEQGDVDNAICEGGKDFLRILDIHDYLEKRAERV